MAQSIKTGEKNMHIINAFDYIDTHLDTAPFRIVTTGIPALHGENMEEKMLYMKKHFDWMRKRIMCEAGGNRAMVGAVLIEPSSKDADFGLFFIDSLTYQPMCGAGSLAAANAVVQMGMVPVTEPVTQVVFETPTGLIKTLVRVENSNVLEVTLESVASFLYEKDVKVFVEELGEINIDIGFGGNFFVLVDVEPLNLEIKPENRSILADLGMKIIAAANKVMKVQHPINKTINYLDQLMYCQQPQGEGEPYIGQCIYSDYKVDDSPCGTGTCAKMARMHARGELKLYEDFMHANNINPTLKVFKGVLHGETKVGKFDAVLPRVSAFNTQIIGLGKIILTKEDKYKEGFIGV